MSPMRRPQRVLGVDNPLRDAGFRRLWSAHLVSLLGDQLFPIALVSLAIAHGGSIAQTISVVFAARFSALALLIIFGGVVADRVDRVRGMIALNVFRGATVGGMVLMGADTPLAVLAALTFVLGAGEAVFTPLYESVLPEMVPDRMLQQANSLSSLIKNLANVVGPGVAGVIVAAVGARTALFLDVISFAVAAVAMLGLRRARPPQVVTTQRVSVWRSALAGVQVVLRLRWLAALEGMAIVHTLLAVGPWYVLLPTIAVERYGSVQSYGLFLTAFGVGGVLGALAGGRIRSQVRGRIALAGIGTFGFCCLVLAWQVPMAVVVAVFVVGGFGTQMFDVVKTTAIQQTVERQFLGRVFSLDFFAAMVMMPFGQVLAGFLVGSLSMESIMATAGVIVLVTTFLLLFIPQIAGFGGRGSPPDQAAASDAPADEPKTVAS
ncbi:MAG: 2-acyl-glycerophospho-ethanolamine acyltransferase [Actinomycetia bacterium]|nr:2-acyl-glycerophospho-ethanolamine acyltransferase [Actinomycetes bacterium]